MCDQRVCTSQLAHFSHNTDDTPGYVVAFGPRLKGTKARERWLALLATIPGVRTRAHASRRSHSQRYRHIYTDRFFTSISFAAEALALDDPWYVTGTVRKTGLPGTGINEPKERGGWDWACASLKLWTKRSEDYVFAYKWMDTGPVMLLSTAIAPHGAQVRRRVSGGQAQQVVAPTVSALRPHFCSHCFRLLSSTTNVWAPSTQRTHAAQRIRSLDLVVQSGRPLCSRHWWTWPR